LLFPSLIFLHCDMSSVPRWSLTVNSAVPYSFWSFGDGNGARSRQNITNGTLGVSQSKPLELTSSSDGLRIEGALKPSVKTIAWNKEHDVKAIVANIITAHNEQQDSQTLVEIIYNDTKHCFELQSMPKNTKLSSVSPTDLDLIIRNNFRLELFLDALRLICEYNQCLYDMNHNVGFVEYHNWWAPLSISPQRLIDSNKASNGNSNVTLSAKIDQEQLNGNYDRFIVECECNPNLERRHWIAGIVSTHGAGTGWELRLSNKCYDVPDCFEWLFTTKWQDDDGKNHWQHNELMVELKDVSGSLEGWFYLKGDVDLQQGITSFTVNDKTISRHIKGRPKHNHERSVEFARGYGSKDRKYGGLIRNVKIDGWNG